MSTSKGKTASPENLSKIIKRLTEENEHLKQAVGPAPITNPKDPLRIPAPQAFKGKPGTLQAFLTQARLYIRFQHSALLYESNKVLAITAYLKGNATAWFKPTKTPIR